MESESKHLEALLVSLRRNEKRSPLFHWLAKHQDEILQALAGERIDWRTAVARFKEAGLTDATGKPPTPRTARETWYQVRRLIAARMAGQVSSGPVKILPSKMSKDARPSVAPGPARLLCHRRLPSPGRPRSRSARRHRNQIPREVAG